MSAAGGLLLLVLWRGENQRIRADVGLCVCVCVGVCVCVCVCVVCVYKKRDHVCDLKHPLAGDAEDSLILGRNTATFSV